MEAVFQITIVIEMYSEVSFLNKFILLRNVTEISTMDYCL
jgi:hypothetical protein